MPCYVSVSGETVTLHIVDQAGAGEICCRLESGEPSIIVEGREISQGRLIDALTYAHDNWEFSGSGTDRSGAN